MSEENKGLTVSYSAIDTYLSCSEKYRLERILKIIPEAINTSLMFGKAIDDASEVIFRPFMKDADKEYSRDEMLLKFKTKLTTLDYQNKELYAPDNILIKYSKADVQPELLEKEDLEAIKKYINNTDLIIDNIPNFIEYYKDTKLKLDDETAIYNYIAWHCLYRKGIMMLDTLKKWADENIEEVISIQRKIEIKNDIGDILIGYLDLEAILKRDGIPRTIDLKTASKAKRQYPDDKIKESMQLAIYAQESQKEVMYLVIDKEVKKKEPRIFIHELLGTISEKQLDDTFDKIEFALNGIKAKKFEKNFDACFRFGKCFLYDYCRTGKGKGLIEKSTGKELDRIV